MKKEKIKEVPAHRARLELPDDKVKAEKERLRKLLISDLATAFATAEGKRALKYIAELCGHNKTSIGGNPTLGMDVDRGTLYNEARRTVYLELRGVLPSYLLKEVEFNQIEEIE